MIQETPTNELPPASEMNDLGAFVLYIALLVPSLNRGDFLIRHMNKCDGSIDGFLNSKTFRKNPFRRMTMKEYIREEAGLNVPDEEQCEG